MAEAFGDVVSVEAQAWACAGAQAPRAEVVGVGVDPGALDAPPFGDLGGGEQPPWPRRSRCGEQFGEAAGERLDRFRGKAHLAGV